MNPYTAHREGLITREERDAEIMNREYKTLDTDADRRTGDILSSLLLKSIEEDEARARR